MLRIYAFYVALVWVFGAVMLSMAHAQAPTPPAPITLTAQDVTQLQNYLGEQPLKFALPVLNWLNSLEQRAQADAKKAAEAVKTPKSHVPPASVK